MRTVAALTVWLIGVMSAAASEAPTIGMLFNTKETHSLTYHCDRNRDGLLDCQFAQTIISNKAKSEDLNRKLNQAPEEFRNGDAKTLMSADNCTMFNDLVEILEGRKPAPKGEGLAQLTDAQKQDLLVSANAFLEFCRSRTEESYIKAIRAAHSQELRTCKVFTNIFKQRFQFVQDNVTGAGSWVVQDVPSGACGIVQLSRFEPELVRGSVVLWRYLARKAVTNPQGIFAPGVSCKDLDESQYVYDWRSKQNWLGCDYIEFGP